MPAAAIAAAISLPNPGRLVPSTRTACMISVLRKPAALAALTSLAPFKGATNTTPIPGDSAARRARMKSRLAPALARAASFFARPPGRSSISAAHTTARVIFIFMSSPGLMSVGEAKTGDEFEGKARHEQVRRRGRPKFIVRVEVSGWQSLLARPEAAHRIHKMSVDACEVLERECPHPQVEGPLSAT